MQRQLLHSFYVIIKEISMLLESLLKRAERFWQENILEKPPAVLMAKGGASMENDVQKKRRKLSSQNRTERGDRTKSDVILKEFWQSNEHFADLFNAVAFQGKQVLKPEMLREMDTDLSGTIRFPKYEESLVRMRDVVKKAAFGMEFVILGIESQQKIHYAMPLRTMLYDGMTYLKEYREIALQRKNIREEMTPEEFLSGMRKEDRLHPVLSIVVYYSEISWDGPLSLKEMMTDMPAEIDRLIPDYPMNLVQICESDGYQFHNDDVRTVFELSREIMRGNFDRINEKYKDKKVKSELVTVVGKITDSKELMKHREKKEAEINMCTALEKLKDEGRKEGRKKLLLTQIRKKQAKGFSIPEIADILEEPEEEIRRILEEADVETV